MADKIWLTLPKFYSKKSDMACFEARQRYLTYFEAAYELYTKQGCQANIFGTSLLLFGAQKSVFFLLSQIKCFLFIIFNRWILEISALAFFWPKTLVSCFPNDLSFSNTRHTFSEFFNICPFCQLKILIRIESQSAHIY